MNDSTAAPTPPSMPDPLMVPSSDDVEIASYLFAQSSDRRSGAAADSPYLLAHANGLCAAVFAPLIEQLGSSAVTYDARAHGLSSGAGKPMAWERHRDDLLAVHDAYRLDRPLGIGHSMGGAALLLAEQLRPGTFKALWLFEPIVFPSDLPQPDGPNPLEQGALRRRAVFQSREAAYANFASKPPLNDLAPESLAAYVEYGFRDLPDGEVTLACRPEDEAAGYAMGARHGAWDALDKVICPVLVVRGAEGAMPGPADLAPAIAQRLPNGASESHPELGHFGPLEDPGRSARSIHDFVRSIEPNAGSQPKRS